VDVVYRLLPLETMPQQDLALAMLDRLPNGEAMRLPAGEMIRFGLLIKSRSQRLLGPSTSVRTDTGADSGGRTWKERSAHATAEGGIAYSLESREVWSTGLSIRTPSSPGQYMVKLCRAYTLVFKLLPSLSRSAPNAYQTSASASQSLSAAYVLEEPSSTTITSSAIAVALQATNTGQSVWLADPKR